MLPSALFRVSRVCRPDGTPSPRFLEVFVVGREPERAFGTSVRRFELSPWASSPIRFRCLKFDTFDCDAERVTMGGVCVAIQRGTVYYEGPLVPITWSKLRGGAFVPLAALDKSDGNEKVVPIANAFGVPFTSRSWALWCSVDRHLGEYEKRVLKCPRPRLFYHGTIEKSAAMIEKYGFLEDLPPSAGHRGYARMMGIGVYVGHFHKAARFALWDGAHRPRSDGVIVAALFFPRKPTTVATKTRFPYPFPHHEAMKTDPRWKEKCAFLDPKATWREEFDGIEVPATCPLVSNTEWCVKAERLFAFSKAWLLPPKQSYNKHNRVNPIE